MKQKWEADRLERKKESVNYSWYDYLHKNVRESAVKLSEIIGFSSVGGCWWLESLHIIN